MTRRFCTLAVAGWLAAFAWRVGADEGVASADPAAIFKQLDANGDGQLTDDEAPAARRKLIKRLLRRADANGDGKLSEAEFTAGMKEDRPDLPAEPPAGSGQPYAQFLQADSGEVFKRLDANGDGKIEQNELPEPARARLGPFFENFDVNRDKTLTREEFDKGHAMLRAQAGAGQAGPGPVAAGLLRALDHDGDGQLSKEEIAAASASLLALDKDGDGALNRVELMAGPASTPPPAAEAGAKKKAKAKAAAAKLPDPERLMARLNKMDANGDGKWSESELPPFLKKQFSKIDANGDGQVDADEIKQALEVMRRRAEKRAAKAGKS
ncbi:MAG TPA: EF-hand domain-containing protein [Pirellulales bacterium]|nr:EF-hand domain-containing protein [Pirellulales bacterium]